MNVVELSQEGVTKLLFQLGRGVMEAFFIAVGLLLLFLLACTVIAAEIIHSEEENHLRSKYLKDRPPTY